MIVAASPSPFGGPGEGAAVVRVEGCALLSGCSISTTPVVVIDSVSGCLERPKGVAPGCGALVEGFGGGCGSS